MITKNSLIKKTLATALTLILMLNIVPLQLTWAIEPVKYIDATGTEQFQNGVIVLTSPEDTVLTDLSWYMLCGEKNGSFTLSVSGEVHLILEDNCNWIINGGIRVNEGSSLTIYAQSTGLDMGKLTVTGSSNSAGIGGGNGGSGGIITINGGTIKATGGAGGAGIGGGNGGSGGTITIGGISNVTAIGGYYGGRGSGAGIGGGCKGNGGVINIIGNAIVTAHGGDVTEDGGVKSNGPGGGCNSSGIGGGGDCDGGIITISDNAKVTANGGYYGGAGIGGGRQGTGGIITINGGDTTAYGGAGGAGIGGGEIASSGDITISGYAKVKASGYYGAGIGGGNAGSGDTITINGNANITANGDYSAGDFIYSFGIIRGSGAGIGGGGNGDSGTIIISDKVNITSSGGSNGGAGIGGGASGAGGTITINNSISVTAIGGGGGADIGRGRVTNKQGTFIIADGGIITIDGTRRYIVTFHPNNAQVTTPNALTSALTKADGTLAILPTPTRNNYNCIGWFTAATTGTKVDTSSTFTAHTTLYAQWTEVKSSPPPSGGDNSKNNDSSSNTGDSESVTEIENQLPPLFGREADLAGELYKLKLLRGTGTDKEGNPIFDLESPLTRLQSLILVIRLLGQEEKALAYAGNNPFNDVPAWGVPYVAFGFAEGITNGTSATTFSPNQFVTCQQFSAFLLRVLGYSDKNGDFEYAKTLAFTLSVKFYNATMLKELDNGQFLRSKAIVSITNTLNSLIKGSNDILLIDKLVESKFITEESAQAFKETMSVNKPEK